MKVYILLALVAAVTASGDRYGHGGKRQRYEVSYSKRAYTYHGKYGGKCSSDGIYYRNDVSFVFCTNGNSYVQPCAPGTRNGAVDSFTYGNDYNYNDFCSVNLVDYGYGAKSKSYGYSSKGKSYGNDDKSYGYSSKGKSYGNDDKSYGYSSKSKSYGNDDKSYGYQGYGYGDKKVSYGHGDKSYGGGYGEKKVYTKTKSYSTYDKDGYNSYDGPYDGGYDGGYGKNRKDYGYKKEVSYGYKDDGYRGDSYSGGYDGHRRSDRYGYGGGYQSHGDSQYGHGDRDDYHGQRRGGYGRQERREYSHGGRSHGNFH